MDEKNINISKSEEELLEIMENRSHITADQLHNLKEDEECLQACSDLTVYTNLKVYHFLIKKCTTPNRLRRYA